MVHINLPRLIMNFHDGNFVLTWWHWGFRYDNPRCRQLRQVGILTTLEFHILCSQVLHMHLCCLKQLTWARTNSFIMTIIRAYTSISNHERNALLKACVIVIGTCFIHRIHCIGGKRGRLIPWIQSWLWVFIISGGMLLLYVSYSRRITKYAHLASSQ